ncbi:MAG: hypothetical protein ABIR18_05635, partial [Chitinophagaceae bacterium]
DTIPQLMDPSLAIDTSMDYEGLMDELVSFLDSILAPRSYLLVSASGSNSYFNYKNNSGSRIDTKTQLVLSPTIGYYHKKGPGITVSGNLARNPKQYQLYQYYITPSFDFIQSQKWIGGVSYTRYITKDSLGFYTTPLLNEVNAYYLWRKSWVQPGLAINYGWGSRSDVQKRERYIQLLRLRRLGIIGGGTTTLTEESISDFSITASVRHSFYWLDISRRNDYLKFTPMLVITSGTQKYGFNQTTGSYAVTRNSGKVEYNTGNVNLDSKQNFRPLSLTCYLRPEYTLGKFFIQPQVILDYYFPGTEKKFTALFALNGGFMF